MNSKRMWHWRGLPVAVLAMLLLFPQTDLRAEPDWTRTGAFPPGFLFGVATASHQVEGNNAGNDWVIFEQRGNVADSGEALNHRDLNVLAQDLDLAKSLGVNAYRFSIEWSRVEPTRDSFDQAEIDYYKQVVDLVRARGMTPIVGLNHYTLPTWLLDPNDQENKSGWGLPLSGVGGGVAGCLPGEVTLVGDQFIEFVAKMADELGSRVDHWTTFNEPTGQIAAGYLAGSWSPGRGALGGLGGLGTPEWDSYQCAINQMIEVHRQAYTIIKQHDTIDANGDGRAALVGVVQNVKPIFPHSPGSADDQDAKDWDYVLQKQFLDALTPVFDTGAFPVPAYAASSRASGFNCWDFDFDYACDPGKPSTQDRFLDFIGLNYYNPAESFGSVAGASNPDLGDKTTGGIFNSVLLPISRPGRPANDFSEEVFAGGPWEIFPEGLLPVLRDLWGRYKLPILITENGLAEIGAKGLDCSLTNRPAFIVSHLQMVLQAIAEGIPVLGYLHWSLLDNFEWREAYDARTKFGLYHVRLNNEDTTPLLPLVLLGPTSFKELDPSVPDYQVRTETPGAVAYRQIVQARAITQPILNRWGSFPRIVGDSPPTASEVRSIEIDLSPFPSLAGQEVFETSIPEGCRIIGIDVMYTDGAGSPLPQSPGFHQGGRVAYSTTAGLSVSTAPLQGLEIVESNPSTNNGRVVVRWFRPNGFARFDFRVFYRLDCTEDRARTCDSAAPTIQCGAPDGAWHVTDVSIACTASDDGSGLASPADASFFLTTSVPSGTETANAATGTRGVCDVVGNCATAGPVAGNKVDKKAPTITMNQPQATDYTHNTTLTLDYSVADGGSGVKEFTTLLDGSPTLAGHGLASGQTIELLTELALGPHTFKIDAVDAVGNGEASSVTFTIIVTVDSVKDDVNQFLAKGGIKNAGLANSLLAKLAAAAAERAGGDCAGAAHVYQAFISELNAQSGKGVDTTAAAVMIADAEYLIAHCP